MISIGYSRTPHSYLFSPLNSHGGTRFGIDHRPRLAFRASDSKKEFFSILLDHYFGAQGNLLFMLPQEACYFATVRVLEYCFLAI